MEGCRWLVALDKNECYYEYRKKRKSVSTPAAQRRDGLLEQVKTRRNAYADLSPALLACGEDDVGVDFKGKGCPEKRRFPVFARSVMPFLRKCMTSQTSGCN